MLPRVSHQLKKPEHRLNENDFGRLNNLHNEKENNYQHVNLVKRGFKFNDVGGVEHNAKPERKNYLTNADTRLNVSVNTNNSSMLTNPTSTLSYNSTHTIGQARARIASRIDLKKQFPPKQKPQTNSQQFYEIYGKDIIEEHEVMPIYKADFLKNHLVDAGLRARMLDWMVQVTKSYKFINKSYFASVQLLDRYFALTSDSIPVSQLHILGVVAMCIASKIEQIYPLKIKTIYQKIVHKKISRQALITMEEQFFDALDYQVNSWTFFDLALLKITEEIGGAGDEMKDKVEEVISFISKCIVYDYDLYIRYDMETFAKVLTKIAAKICNLPNKIEAYSYSVSCHEDIVKSFKKFKVNFKGLNNIFKFSDQKIVQIVENYFLQEPKNEKSPK